MMHVLAEHFGRDQRYPAAGDEETLTILHGIDADFEFGWNAAALEYAALYERTVSR